MERLVPYGRLITLLSLLCLAPALFATQADDLFKTATLALQAKHYAEAEAAFREVYRLETENSRGIIGAAQVYAAQDKLQEALDILRPETEKHPERADLHIAIGSSAEGMKQHDVALAEFQKALELMDIAAKDRAAVYMKISEVRRATGDIKNALDALHKAVELAPQNANILTNFAMALEQSGDPQNAVKQYRAALAADPKNPVALNNLAFLMTQTGGDLFEALRYARQAKSLLPQSPDILDTVGWVTLKLGWIDDAVGTFRDLVRKQPGNSSFRTHLALAVALQQPGPANAKELIAALRAEPTPENQKLVSDLLGKP